MTHDDICPIQQAMTIVLVDCAIDGNWLFGVSPIGLKARSQFFVDQNIKVVHPLRGVGTISLDFSHDSDWFGNAKSVFSITMEKI